MAEAVVVPSHHAEVGGVAARFLRGHELYFPYVLLVRRNSAFQSNWYCLQIVTVSAHEKGVFRPGCMTIIAHGPLLLESGSGLDGAAVAETLFDKAA